MQLAGPIAGSQYDQINVTGQLALAGDLDVVLLDGFQPQAGESFQLFDGQLSGSFSQVSLPALNNGLSWDTSNLDATGTISVVPEPSTLALLAAGVSGFSATVCGNASGSVLCRTTARPSFPCLLAGQTRHEGQLDGERETRLRSAPAVEWTCHCSKRNATIKA